MRTGTVPTDYVTFVAEHGPRLARACAEIVGDDRQAQQLHDDLLVAVARRWSRWPAGDRARSALAWVQAQVRLRNKRLGTHAPAAALSLTASAVLPVPPGPAASLLWQRAARSRRLWWRRLALVAAAVLAVAWLVPRTAPPAKLPTQIPAGVTVLPPLYDLLKLPDTLAPLPVYLRLDATSVDDLPALADEPLPRALLVALATDERLVLVDVAPDPQFPSMRIFGTPQRRALAHPALAGARLLTTSLSPDGRTVALPRRGDVVLVDVPTGTVRSAPQLPSWARGSTARPGEVPTDNPRWVGARTGPRWASTELFVHACDPATLLLPEDVGVATAAVTAVASSGRHAGTLVTTDGARLDVLGFYGAQWALLLVRSAGLSAVVAWDPPSGTLNMGTVVTTEATLAVAGLLS